MIDSFANGESPKALGFVMPPEWSAQEAVFLSWPSNPETWPGVFRRAEEAYATFASAISQYERVRILCAASEFDRVNDALADADAHFGRIELLDIPTNDAWCRDHGPVFVKNPQTGERAVLDFTYNAWGGKFPPWDRDDAVPAQVAEQLGFRRFRIPFVCEGGALEVNGAGDLLTTRSVILNPNRNPEITEPEAERILRESLGVEQVLWLDRGLAGDDTDGHIDTLARFVSEDVVLAPSAPAWNPNHDVLRDNIRALRRMRTADSGSLLEVIPLNSPRPIRPEGWREEILPATYANFLLINQAVLVPTYRQDFADSEALAVIAQAYPGRTVIPIDCSDIILEGGALHCLSQQQPR